MEPFGVVTVCIRCERCLATLGRAAPIMGHVIDSGDGKWMVDRWQRRPGRSGQPRHRDPDTDEIYAPGRGARGLELRCRVCRHTTRVAIRRLHALADAATIRAGRGDIYV
jgi:hypothetical protein